MSRLQAAVPRRQRGQSMTEFLVLALVLIPLMVIVPLLGAYLDMSQHAVLASRYVAFEAVARHASSAAGWKSDAMLAQEVRRRFFSTSDAPIKTNDAAGDFVAHRNPVWTTHHAKPLLPSFADNVQATTEKFSLDQPAGALFASDFGLPQESLYRGTVKATPANVAGLPVFESIGLSMTRSTALLSDSWTAGGSGMVRSRVAGADAAFPWKVGIQPYALPHEVLLPAVMDFTRPDVGHVQPDTVPGDRLGAYE
jgi:hypothetical protein